MSTPENKKEAFTDDGGMNLDGLGDLSQMLDATPGAGGKLDIALDLIDEDPNQPRQADNPGFTPQSLGELSETIKERGVKSPISLRDNPEEDGRYIINHGARRFRASKMAGKETIPAFVDNDYLEVDQVIENLQRNELTAREIADFIGREIAKGQKKGEIARTIGKSNAYITQHAALLDLPDPIAKVFSEGRVTDVTVINELVTAYKKNPEEVQAWLDDETQDLSRTSIKLMREYLEDKRQNNNEEQDGDSQREVETQVVAEAEDQKPATPKKDDPDKIKKAIVQVVHDDRPARILLTRRPSSEGMAWLKYDDDGHEFEINLSIVKLVSVIEG